MIIFDLDGTLSDQSHRQHLVGNLARGDSPQWAKFYRDCVNDAPKPDVINLFLILYKARKHLQIWSARDEIVRTETVAWLYNNIYKGHYRPAVPLRMRPKGDTRPDDLLKMQWLDEALNDGEFIEFVVDDRQKMVDMWRHRGITCFQCAPGDF